MARSVANATTALTELRRTLEAGGFREGARAYEQMVDMLVWQRLWAESQGVDLRAEFDAAGAVAAEVFALLEPYASAVRRLATFAPAPVRACQPEEESVSSALRRRGGRGATLSTIARESGLSRERTMAALEALVSRGSAQVRGSGGARLYRLSRDDGFGRQRSTPDG